MKVVVADHAHRPQRRRNRPGPRRRQTGLRPDDDNEKIDIAAIEAARRG